MSTYRLENLLRPQSIALVGGSAREGSLGRAVLRNMRNAGFTGSISLVNSRHSTIDGLRSVRSLADLASPPDIVVICVPPASVPSIVAEAGTQGAAAAIIITAGLGHGPGSLAEACEKSAHAVGLRLVGPNCLGVLVPEARLNASFASRMPLAGDLAVISQSGAIAAGLVEWGYERAVGFSAIVSIGDQLDVDFGDLLDFFAFDRATRAILLYVESVKDARKFMSAARAAARTKPVVVVKSGRHSAAAKAAATHTGALAGSDAVYEAAFRRAGLLRVLDLGELFDAAETLSRVKAISGKRLAILTNGGGAGVLAVDRLLDLGGVAADLSEDVRTRLDAVLPATWSRSNPVDIIGDADDARYRIALELLVSDCANDAVLVMNVPTALGSPTDIARTVAQCAETQQTKEGASKPLFSVWVGAERGAFQIFDHARIPHYPTETDAVRGFMHLVGHSEAITALMEVPPSLPEDFAPDISAARRVVMTALSEARNWLEPLEIVDLFKAYAIPTVPAVFASTPEEAERASAPLLAHSQKVVVKVVSRDIVHKSEVGGVKLNLSSPATVRGAAEEIIANVKAARPEAQIAGVSIHPMISRPTARELIAGIADDEAFGPVVLFGHGGTAVEVINDRALALPPLDLKLARELIERTRVSRLLRAYRDVPQAKVDEIALVLVKLAQLIADVPEIRELDINPLIADDTGVLALDARVAVAKVVPKFTGRGHPRLAIRPYPKEWERRVRIGEDWHLMIRPVRPEDEYLVRAFFDRVSPEDLRLRFFAPVKEFSHVFIARLTQLDYARAIAFVAIDETTCEMVGGVRLHADANYHTGEYAILLRSDVKGRGLGWKLMNLIIEYAQAEGLEYIKGQILRENSAMLRMCRELGFNLGDDPGDPGSCVAVLAVPPPKGGS
jgi:acetyltransferase